MGLLEIDQILEAACKMRIVRWGLLLGIAAMMIGAGVLAAKNYYLTTSLKLAKSDIAAYAERIEVQNTAILKAAAEYKAQEQAIEDAKRKASQHKKDAAEWRKKALETPLTGDCEEMVNQVLDVIK